VAVVFSFWSSLHQRGPSLALGLLEHQVGDQEICICGSRLHLLCQRWVGANQHLFLLENETCSSLLNLDLAKNDRLYSTNSHSTGHMEFRCLTHLDLDQCYQFQCYAWLCDRYLGRHLLPQWWIDLNYLTLCLQISISEARSYSITSWLLMLQLPSDSSLILRSKCFLRRRHWASNWIIN